MRVVLAGGGTAGHIEPALALADALRQADKGISLEAQAEKIRAMATLHDHQLLDVLVDGGESAKSLKRQPWPAARR